MRILVVSDAWLPQVNGVVRTLDILRRELQRDGHEVVMVTPDRFRTLPCPTYPEIRLAVRPGRLVARLIEAAQPCAIHIATEGPLGWAARRYCLRRRLPFTTAYHTKFPEYIKARFRVPLKLSYAVMRRFHAASSRVMVATQGIESELLQRGFHRIGRWSRGVDTDLFHPRPEARGEAGPFAGLARPIFLYVGRVAVEKNVQAFLDLDLPGTKAVVGAGPQLEDLRRRHPGVHFAGARFGEDLARHYAAADVFVFPSRTDTFGLVLLEALASGLPVAAYPVPGPLDVIGSSPVGRLDQDLRAAALAALEADPALCRAYALEFSWAASTRQFIENLAPFETTRWQEPMPA
ncbi:glycosyltransferase family 4 protein [Phaeospirillum tilakii]|uniref:Glycosyltransferase family 4 protein n=1 Tax=Phaeospirillum tilakii TaxID=741673 RepID=A0ABW5C9V5_9PROT